MQSPTCSPTSPAAIPPIGSKSTRTATARSTAGRSTTLRASWCASPPPGGGAVPSDSWRSTRPPSSRPRSRATTTTTESATGSRTGVSATCRSRKSTGTPTADPMCASSTRGQEPFQRSSGWTGRAAEPLRFEGLPTALAWGALWSVCLAPFLFGAVERSVWIPLCQLWLGLGLTSTLIQARLTPSSHGQAGQAVSRALLPIHALFVLQLVPLPAAVLRLLSPGSYAAHFFPDPGDGRFRPLSISPSSTIEAWLYLAGLQGLFLTLVALPAPRRRRALHVLLGAIVALAAEGLWQSQTAHPWWFYSRVPNVVPSGFETASFGPYYNRNHFATIMALGTGLAAGLAAAALHRPAGFTRLLHDTTALARVVVLAGTSILLVLTSAASGSRSGALAALSAV